MQNKNSNYEADDFVIENFTSNLGLHDEIIIIDGGARNKLFPPVDKINNKKVYAFDADPSAEILDKSLIKMPYGLWKNSEKVQLHIALQPTTSSIYPPNLELCDFLLGPEYGTKCRKTLKKAYVNCVSLDDLYEQGKIPQTDIIKLDVHSAEYEVLESSKLILPETKIVLVETWGFEFHHGQKLTSHVEVLMNSYGFYGIDIDPSYGFNQACSYGNKLNGDRRLLHSTDTLFVNFNHFESENDAIKQIVLMSLFRYNTIALKYLEDYLDNKIIEKKIYLILKELILKSSLKSKLSPRNWKFYPRYLKNIIKAILRPSSSVVYDGKF